MCEKNTINNSKNLFDNWHKYNQWFMHDEELSNKAFEIHQKLVLKNIKPNTLKYWESIDIELYKSKKNLLLTYFSIDN